MDEEEHIGLFVQIFVSQSLIWFLSRRVIELPHSVACIGAQGQPRGLVSALESDPEKHRPFQPQSNEHKLIFTE